MNKEPLGLYIFRFVLAFGLFAFMAMLYWSSLVIEEDLKDIRSEITELKNDQPTGHTDTYKIRNEAAQNNPKMDSSLPNLLSEDPFYAKTLPQLLGNNFQIKGVFQSATVGRPNNLHPFSNWSQVASWNDQCTVSLTRNEFGKFETYAPDMAIKIEARKRKGSETSEFWVFLRDNVYWQPLKQELFSEQVKLAPQFLKKHQVTAHDFKFYYDAMMNPHLQEAGAVAQRTFYDDLEEIEVIDDLTFVVRWKIYKVKEPDGKTVDKIKYMAKSLTGGLKPLPIFVYQYFPDGKKIIEDDSDPDTYRTNSVWAQNFSEHWARNIIISCGPWIFEGMNDREIKFKRNPDYFNPIAVLVEGSVIEFKEAPDGIWQDFKNDKLDSFSLQPDQLVELANFLKSPEYAAQVKRGESIKRLDFLARSYNYIGWNQAKPFFTSKKVRQALTMAIDRQRIIQQNLNGLGVEISCPFYLYSPSCDPSIKPWPFDMQQARRLLEEEGWVDTDGDGIIDKVVNGKRTPFRFSLTYFVKNSVNKAICEYIATSLKELEIECQLHGVDIADLSSSFDDKSFDAICLGWSLGSPPEDPKQLWYSTGAQEKGSSNAIGFSNKEADQIIDVLQYEYDEKKRIELYHRFDAIIHEEAPYTFLYSPKTAFLYREYLQNVFIPAERQDLIPEANIAQPDSSIFWIKK